MKTIKFVNFDLVIEPVGKAFRARVTESPAGQAEVIFSRPFSDLELENFYLRIGRPRYNTRRIDSPEMAAIKKCGGKLFEYVFSDEVYACLKTSLVEAKRQDKGLRVRLRINAPKLLDLPWEYLYNRAENRFLSLSLDTPIVRYVDMAVTEPSLTVNLPLKILVMISSPKNYQRLDVELEYQKLCKALDKLVKKGVVIVERLEEASLLSLKRQLRVGEYHIFHYIGHGGFDENAQEGVLIFENESKQGQATSSTYLGTILHNHKSLRLAVLNSCEGARTSLTDPFAGAAMNLVQQGIPAVIGMQFEISDDAAIIFSEELYSALTDGYPVDAALVEARTAIFANENAIEWGTPVLFTRSNDCRIFDLNKSETQDEFNQVSQPKTNNNDEAKQSEQEKQNAKKDEETEKKIYSKLHGTICVETLGGVATPLLWEGETLPALTKQIFSTASDNQSQVEIHLTFGGNKLAKDNISLHSFLLTGIPPAPKGKPQIEISFYVDEGLNLSVFAIDKGSGFSQNLKDVNLSTVEAPKEIDPLSRTNETQNISSSKADVDDLFGNGGFSDFFQTIFGRGSSGLPTKKKDNDISSSTPRNLEKDITISLEEAVFGKEVILEVSDEEICKICKGKGVEESDTRKRCGFCNGTGLQQSEKRVSCKIPAGIDTGRKIRFAGIGKFDISTGKKGNLYLKVFVEKHSLFSREGDNLRLVYPLSKERFKSGEKVKIPIIDGGFVELSLPYNIEDGIVIPIFSRGVFTLNSSRRGKLLVHFKKYNSNSIDPETKAQIERINLWIKK